MTIQSGGLPLSRGSRLPRIFEQLELVDYALHSEGRFCTSTWPPWLVEGLFDPAECRERCTLAPTCGFFTIYGNGWCQLSIRCEKEAVAGDPSAVTYAKVKRAGPCTAALPEDGCLGPWVAMLGKPLAPRRE
eukprot:CAMPEP_0171143866 /NCGR_PEP_ID=MMETSP0766_2-20121228/144999_1 /TAXON_ID=439317 /ORGANISM="Gambierdiscus australes, Strain CAWD 149" /LENGTH=131 /DNA_ID=CAMNT_0011607699 /DNA_START=62 /DNA_END=454 /DNA_ORIENTATION=+